MHDVTVNDLEHVSALGEADRAFQMTEEWPSLTGSLLWIIGEATRLEPARTEVAALLVDFLRRSLSLLIGVALCAVLAPVAVYFALSDE